MKTMQARTNLPLLLLLTLSLLSSPLVAQEQSLGELARQQKAQKKATKVITDEDFPTHAPSKTAATQPVETTASEASESADTAADEKSKLAETADKSDGQTGPQYTAPQASAQEKVEQLKRLEALLVKKIDELEKGMKGEPDESLHAGYRETIEANKKALASTREQLTAAEKELAETSK